MKEHNIDDTRAHIEAILKNVDDIREHIEAIIKNVLQDEDTDCGNEVLCSIIASRCAKQILKVLNLCE